MNKKKLSLIQNLLDEIVEKKLTAGANCLILKDGIEQCYYQSGYIDVEKGKPINRDSLFRLYSMSKTITSAATMLLVERGVIDLYENVSKYIPSFANPKIEKPDGTLVDATREIHIGDLLSMSSGLTYPGITSPSSVASDKLITEVIEKMHSAKALTTMEIADRIGANPLAFDPGSHWEYGLSADVLGAVIESATGMKYGDFLKENIFDPLGMKDIGFYVPEDKYDRLANLYKCDGNDFTLYTQDFLGVSNKMDKSPAFESGGAGLCASIDDFVPFSQMLLNGGSYNGVRLMSPETVKYMTTFRLPDKYRSDIYNFMPHLAGYTYGNLLRVMVADNEAITLGNNGEYGWDGWTGTYFANDPANHLTILFMRQRSDCGTDDITRKLRNLIYAAL